MCTRIPQVVVSGHRFQVFAEHLKWAYVEGVAVLLHVLISGELGMAGGSAKTHKWKLPILCIY